MSITLAELSKRNSFIYNQYANNQIIGYKGTITNGSCYISNRTIREGMLIDYQSLLIRYTFCKLYLHSRTCKQYAGY